LKESDLMNDELFDEIVYRLDGAFFAGPTLDDEKTKYAIAHALMKLPEEVQEFALTELLFAATGNASYYVKLEHIARQQQLGKKWIVFLVSVGVEGRTAEDVETVADTRSLTPGSATASWKTPVQMQRCGQPNWSKSGGSGGRVRDPVGYRCRESRNESPKPNQLPETSRASARTTPSTRARSRRTLERRDDSFRRGLNGVGLGGLNSVGPGGPARGCPPVRRSN
jgi:hypothetical protein